MPRRDLALPARMVRIALVAPEGRLRELLATVADSGVVELVGPLPPPEGEALEALRRMERKRPSGQPLQPHVLPETPDVGELERSSARDLLAGEVELQRRAASAVRHNSFAGFVGWTPESELALLSARLAPIGGAVAELPKPAWVDPPTLLRPARLVRPFRPIVETYGAARYEDVDPTPFAAVAFVLMFGMMFGDVGDGLLLALLGLLLRRARGRFARFRPAWPLVVACGLSGVFFGLLYGECFGPTGLVPTLWFNPLDDPLRLLVAALVVGAVLLTISYAIGIVNRWRETGAVAALVAPSGIAGFLVFIGLVLTVASLVSGATPLAVVGLIALVVGAVLLALGFLVEAGSGPTAVTQVTVEVVDAVVRVGANTISFTRLAAFGVMHGALTAIVFDAASALWGIGVVASILAIAVFVVGNAAAFALEAFVAGIQALRLEYYELFSRIFAGEGRAFSPWWIPLATPKEEQ
jgi:V/A-type H+-transporting ATPase subunit I